MLYDLEHAEMGGKWVIVVRRFNATEKKPRRYQMICVTRTINPCFRSQIYSELVVALGTDVSCRHRVALPYMAVVEISVGTDRSPLGFAYGSYRYHDIEYLSCKGFSRQRLRR